MHKVTRCFVLILLTTFAAAQDHSQRFELFTGYSYINGSLGAPLNLVSSNVNLHGWNSSFGTKVIPHLRVVADFGGNYASPTAMTACLAGTLPLHCDVPLHSRLYNFLFGPQVEMNAGKVTPFARLLFGVGHVVEVPGVPAPGNGVLLNSGSVSDTGFAFAAGGGMNYMFTERFGVRGQAELLHDRLFTNPDFNIGAQNDFRFSTGLVVRF